MLEKMLLKKTHVNECDTKQPGLTIVCTAHIFSSGIVRKFELGVAHKEMNVHLGMGGGV